MNGARFATDGTTTYGGLSFDVRDRTHAHVRAGEVLYFKISTERQRAMPLHTFVSTGCIGPMYLFRSDLVQHMSMGDTNGTLGMSSRPSYFELEG